MTPVEKVLEEIRAAATDETDKGRRFERLMVHVFRTDRTFRKQFREVWLWENWPGRDSGDIGIDLVAEDYDGGLVAIQCKCYDPDASLTKHDIDSFVSLSSQAKWTRRIIVATTDHWATNAEKALEGHTVPIERIGIDDLDAMTIEWESLDVTRPAEIRATEKHTLRPHQQVAVDRVRKGFESGDRGKLIMACGTGKTFTALRIAEQQAGAGRSVLFLAPSIALVAQSLKEWTAECEVPVRPFAVCSDKSAGRQGEGENATEHDLVIPATTDTAALTEAGVHESASEAMTVVFSTYQSIEVVAEMQARTGHVFDLVVCDEAHRTAGVASVGEEDGAFALVHDNGIVPAAKRLYMTATPRLFKPVAKEAAREADAVLASMDDPEFFGEEFHRLGFGEAVEQGLLADYRVLILTVDENAVSGPFQELLSTDGDMNLPDVAKFVGCLSGLAKLPSPGDGGFTGDEPAMQRAVAFWSNIKESEKFAGQFDQVADAFFEHRETTGSREVQSLAVPTRHVDGRTRISSRRADIRWLKESPEEGECRVLTNAKCLTEGVDVPALDAVMFLTPRRSNIDIVQAVGRVMRKPPGKDLGYVILPIAVAAGQNPKDALDKNKDYDVVWDVLQALRAHDERFNAYINQIALSSTPPGNNPEDPIQVIPAGVEEPDEAFVQDQLFQHQEWTDAIYSKIVDKVGTRTYWEDWANDVAAIASRHQARIISILDQRREAADAFEEFVGELHATLNDSISRDDAVSMVSQHLITRPIFEALFGDDAFGAANPVSQAMSRIVAVLDKHHLETETDKLDDFYASIQRRVEGIHPDDGEARQRIIKDLYGRFFKTAFPKVADQLGIVYTPIEVVDFIIRAVEAALHEHFDGASLSDEGVHVLDPFTGTGTFITRLIQSGFIKPHDLARKFTEELHANEFLLLAYYIAAVNIETTYRQELAREFGEDPGYKPFPGVVLTDTFQLGETGDGTGTFDVFPINNERATRQQGLDIRVILGNPPYSVGQQSANDDNANLRYQRLDESIAATYAARTEATNKNKLYDSYLRGIRWASNRLLDTPQGGVVAFITNSGYIDSNSLDGLRLTLTGEFHHLYIYNLRGNQRTAGEMSRREGGKIFDSGSRAGTAIMLLIKQPGEIPGTGATLHYQDIGDYLTREDKLTIIANTFPQGSSNQPDLKGLNWSAVEPNENGDWINQRSESFYTHPPVTGTDGDPGIFSLRTLGLATGRDAWNHNSSRLALDHNIGRMIDAYNEAADEYHSTYPLQTGKLPDRARHVSEEIRKNPRDFSWNANAYTDVARGVRYEATDSNPMAGTYRPFHRRWAEAGQLLNARLYQLPRVFPREGLRNIAIGCSGMSDLAEFSVLVTDQIPDQSLMGSGNHPHWFPLHIYPVQGNTSGDGVRELFEPQGQLGYHSLSPNVTDHALGVYRELDTGISKDDIFFYVYGILHSQDYRTTFATDLKKSLPRIPQVETPEDFWAFSQAGRSLAHLHTEYETVDPWPDLAYRHTLGFDSTDPEHYRVKKMKHPRIADAFDPKKKVNDRSRIIYNEWITIENIPDEAYQYELGSRSAVAWVMDAWQVKTDKKSGITNDPNDWATEHDDPQYIFRLVGQVVTVSMKTLEIVNGLPRLNL